jgi:hypothetical protein
MWHTCRQAQLLWPATKKSLARGWDGSGLIRMQSEIEPVAADCRCCSRASGAACRPAESHKLVRTYVLDKTAGKLISLPRVGIWPEGAPQDSCRVHGIPTARQQAPGGGTACCASCKRASVPYAVVIIKTCYIVRGCAYEIPSARGHRSLCSGLVFPSLDSHDENAIKRELSDPQRQEAKTRFEPPYGGLHL